MRQCLSQHIPGNEPLRLLQEMMRHGLERLGHDAQHRRVCHIVLHRCEGTEDGHPADALMRAMFEDARAVLLSLCNEIAELGQLRSGLDVCDATDMVMAFMCGHYECVLRHPETYTADRDWAPLVTAALRGIFDTQALEASGAAPIERSTVCPQAENQAESQSDS
jgi:hypothetical protein